MIYDFLYYKTYLLAEKSGNYKGIPILGGIIFVSFCFMLNLGIPRLILSRFNIFHYSLSVFEKILLAGIVLGSTYFYYWFRERGRKVIEKYESLKEKHRIYKLHPIIVILIYCSTSAAILCWLAKVLPPLPTST